MAHSVGERAKQEASAFKARGWYRGMEIMAYGTGQWRESNGKPLKMRHELREGRAQGMEARNDKAMVAQGWRQVESIALLGIVRDAGRLEEINNMLDLLQLQTPDIFDRYDALEEQRFAQADVSDAALGSFRTNDPWAESEALKAAMPEFSFPKFDTL